MLLMQIPALTFNKLSIVSFYRRIFVQRSKSRLFDILTLIVMIILAAWAVAFFLTELFICKTKFVYIWNSKYSIESSSTCLDLVGWDQAFTSTDFILDLVVLVLPIRQVCEDVDWELRSRTNGNPGKETRLICGLASGHEAPNVVETAPSCHCQFLPRRSVSERPQSQ